MESPFDDTLPLPEEVERELLAKTVGGSTASAWLAEHGADTPAPPQATVIQYGVVFTPETGRYKFVVYGQDHVGPKYAPELAVPIFENGTFIDLLVVTDQMQFASVTCRASWLGRENLALPLVRLHAHPMDWLEAGCTGACHIAPFSRNALDQLAKAETVECNDIETALEAWNWGFDGDDAELARFEIDDTPRAIQAYYERAVSRHVARVVADMERARCW